MRGDLLETTLAWNRAVLSECCFALRTLHGGWGQPPSCPRWQRLNFHYLKFAPYVRALNHFVKGGLPDRLNLCGSLLIEALLNHGLDESR